VHHLFYRTDGIADAILNGFDSRSNITKKFRRLSCEFFHFRSDNGKSLPCCTCTGRLNGGIQSKQVRLRCDGTDAFDHIANLLCVTLKFLDTGLHPAGPIFNLPHDCR